MFSIGTHPPPESWKKWRVNRLEHKTHKVADDGQTQAARSVMDMNGSSKDSEFILEAIHNCQR